MKSTSPSALLFDVTEQLLCARFSRVVGLPVLMSGSRYFFSSFKVVEIVNQFLLQFIQIVKKTAE